MSQFSLLILLTSGFLTASLVNAQDQAPKEKSKPTLSDYQSGPEIWRTFPVTKELLLKTESAKQPEKRHAVEITYVYNRKNQGESRKREYYAITETQGFQVNLEKNTFVTYRATVSFNDAERATPVEVEERRFSDNKGEFTVKLLDGQEVILVTEKIKVGKDPKEVAEILGTGYLSILDTGKPSVSAYRVEITLQEKGRVDSDLVFLKKLSQNDIAEAQKQLKVALEKAYDIFIEKLSKDEKLRTFKYTEAR